MIFFRARKLQSMETEQIEIVLRKALSSIFPIFFLENYNVLGATLAS